MARRGHATALVASGADLRAISARLGHKKPSLVLEIYAQLGSDADRKLAAVTGDLLTAKKETA